MKSVILLMRIYSTLTLLVVASAFLPGCGKSGPPKYRVTADVSWEGEPLPVGDILLEPTDGGIPDAGKIIAGKVEMQATAGPKKVQILASREGEYDPAMGMARRESYIPLKYNAQTILTADVRPDGENHLTLELTAKAR